MKYLIIWCWLSWLVAISSGHSKCGPVYGSHGTYNKCTFLPAPPGHTPPCARPGHTYCESLAPYPVKRIKYLVHTWEYDFKSIFSDESRDDFSTYRVPVPHGPYPPSGVPENHYNYGRKHNYQDSPFTPNQIYKHQDSLGNYNSDYAVSSFVAEPHYNSYNSHHNDHSSSQQLNPEDWWQKYGQPGTRRKRSTTNSKLEAFKSLVLKKHRKIRQTPISKKIDTGRFQNFSRIVDESLDDEINNRTKRQSGLSSQQLCATRSQYIMPKAALNNMGEWKYLVNLPEVDNRLTQLVKSEICVSQECDGICSLPTGYTSRCEQKFVQKRLIALDGSGQQLYTDIFWFPSCCICTITS